VHAIASSTDSAGTARFETTFLLWQPADEEHAKPFSDAQRTAGLIDFADDRGVSRYEPDPMPTTTVPGVERLVDPDEEQRWIGSVVYRKPAMFSGADQRRWESFDMAKVTVPTSCGNKAFPVSFLAVGSGLPSDPGRILDEFAAAGDTLTNAGTVDVRGVATTRWKVGFNATGCHTAQSASAELDVYTDAQQRLRRMAATVPQPESKLPPVVITTDLFDFGIPVHVDAPPAGDVMDITEFNAAMWAGAGKLDGSWRAVAHNSDGDPFTLWFAQTTTGQRCFDLVPDPSSLSMHVIASTNGKDIGPPRHDGHESECLYPGAPPGMATQGFVTRTTGDRVQVVVAFAPGYSNGRIVRADGSSVPVPVDPTTGVVDWTGPASPRITKVQAESPLGTASCGTSPDDTEPGGMLGNSLSLPGLCALSQSTP